MKLLYMTQILLVLLFQRFSLSLLRPLIIQVNGDTPASRQSLRKATGKMLAFVGSKLFTYDNLGKVTNITSGDLYDTGTDSFSFNLMEDSNNKLFVVCGKTYKLVTFDDNDAKQEYFDANTYTSQECSFREITNNKFLLTYSDKSLSKFHYQIWTYTEPNMGKDNIQALINSIDQAICDIFGNFPDIVFCVYRSSKMLKGSFDSINKSEYIATGNIIYFELFKANMKLIVLALTDKSPNTLHGYKLSTTSPSGSTPFVNFPSEILKGQLTESFNYYSYAIFDANTFIYCLTSEKTIYIEKMNFDLSAIQDSKIEISRADTMTFTSNSIGYFNTEDYGIIITKDDQITWLIILPAEKTFCLEKHDYSIQQDSFPELNLLSKDTNKIDDLIIIFLTEGDTNPKYNPQILNLTQGYFLNQKFIYSIIGNYTYTYSLKIDSAEFIIQSVPCSITIEVTPPPCYSTCFTCINSGDSTDHQCSTCQPNYDYFEGMCFLPQCNPDSNYYYIDTSIGTYECIGSLFTCNKQYPFLIQNTKQCTKECPFDKTCIESCYDLCLFPNQVNLLTKTCDCLSKDDYENEQNIALENPDKIIELINPPSIISKDNTTHAIYNSPRDEQKYDEVKNISKINPDELRKNCNLLPEEELIIHKVDNYVPGKIVPQVSIKYYYKNGSEINISNCKEDISISITVPILNPNNTEFIQAKKMFDKDINVYDILDPFFEDICFKFNTENNTDIPLKAKLLYYYKDNSSMCPDDSNFIGIDYKTNTSICKSQSQKDTKKNKTNDFIQFKDNLINSILNVNWEVVKCYDNIIDPKILLINYGSWMMFFLISIEIIVLIFFCKTKFKSIETHIHPFVAAKKQIQSEHDIIKNDQKKPKSSSQSIVIGKQKTLCHTEIKTKQESKVFTDNEFDDMELDDLVKNDKRNIIRHYWSFLRNVHPIIFLIIKSPRILTTLKVSLFIMGIATDFALSAFFYSDDFITSNYTGNSNFFTDLPVAAYSFALSSAIGFLFNFLTKSESGVIEIERTEGIPNKINLTKKFMKRFKIKLFIYNMLKFIVLAGLWYYTASFCAVYNNSQIEWIKSGCISFGISQVIPFSSSLLLTILLRITLGCKSNCCFKVLSFIRVFL